MQTKHDDRGTIRVLVYGTLKKDQSNHGLIESARGKFIGHDSVTGNFSLLDLGSIPAAIHVAEENPTKIKGEIYSIDEEGLAALDMLEGHPNLYRREKLWSDILKKRVWVYFMKERKWITETTADRVIDDGLWRPTDASLKFWEERDAS